MASNTASSNLIISFISEGKKLSSPAGIELVTNAEVADIKGALEDEEALRQLSGLLSNPDMHNQTDLRGKLLQALGGD